MSDRDNHKIGTVRQLVFELFDPNTGLPVTGEAANFTATLLLGGVSPGSPPVVTITEIGVGRYLAQYTPGALGYWYLSIRHALLNQQGWTDEITGVAIAFGELTAATITAIAVAVVTLPLSAVEVSIRGVRCIGSIIQRVRNKTARTAGATWTVYEADNTTAAWTITTTTDPTQAPVVSETPS